jgi:uncharacterized protein (DUF2141 family)
MSKLTGPVAAAALALFAPAVSARATVLGPDAAACLPGAEGPAVLVNVDGFKKRTGKVRVQIYGSNPADFLAKGRKIRRVDLPVVPAGPMQVCVALPAPGKYAVAVRHDVQGTGKSDWNDGGGFSRNPKLSLMSLKPDYKDVVISVGAGPRPVEVILNYRRGLSIRPVAA